MDGLLSKVKTLSDVKQRAVAGLLGAAVADAAGCSLLWIYNDEDMMKAVSDGVVEFHDPSLNPYYRVPCGSFSHYGDQILPILRSLAECGDFDPANYMDQLIKSFGRDSPYHRDYSGEVQYPIMGPYQNSTIKRFNQLYPDGKSAVDVMDDTNNEPDCICRTVPVVTKWAGSPDLLPKAEGCTVLLQSSDVALNMVGVASRLMELYVVNGNKECNPMKLIETLRTGPDVPSDQRDIADLLQTVVDTSKDLSAKEATVKYGKGCAIPGSFQASFHTLLNETSYKEAAKEVILAGGSNCSRLVLIGYCLGAKYGLEGIPRDWINKTHGAEEVLRLGLTLVE